MTLNANSFFEIPGTKPQIWLEPFATDLAGCGFFARGFGEKNKESWRIKGENILDLFIYIYIDHTQMFKRSILNIKYVLQYLVRSSVWCDFVGGLMGFGPLSRKVFSPCLVRSPLNHLGSQAF